MKKRWSLVALVVGPFSILPACSSSSSGGDVAVQPVSIPFEQVPGLVAQTECDLLTKCFGAAAPFLFGHNDCLTQETKTLASSGFAVDSALIAAGKLSYDGTAVQACLDAIKAQGCDSLTNQTPDVCKKVLVGTTAIGGSCTEDGECTGDAACVGNGMCPGVCTAREPVGSACTHSSQCVSGAVCDNQKCVTPAGAGQACQAGMPPCTSALFCVGADVAMMKPGTCKAPADVFSAALGAPCDISQSQYCVTGSFCAVETLENKVATYQCVGPSSAGGACKISVPDSCPSGQYCDADLTKGTDGTCVALLEDGAACAPTLGTAPCKAGSQCLSMVCRPIQDIGGACTTSADCYGVCTAGACAAKTACTELLTELGRTGGR